MNQKIELVERSEVFKGLDCSICTYMASTALARDYAYRDVIFFAGDPIRETLLLTDGRVKITQLGENGSEVILRLNVPGEVIGEVGLVPGCMHSSTAVAVQACKVLVWDTTTFETALDHFPILRRNAERILQWRLDELESRFCEISCQTASPRLAHALVRLLEQIGHKVNSHVEIDVSQEVLAQMTAMTSFTVSRLLTDWENQGLLRLRRGAIEIHSVLRLVGLCKVA